MEESERLTQKHRVYTYRTNTSWLEGKTGELSSEGKHPIRVSSPPEFRGEPNLWTPEDLFVASVEICHMATFLSFARRRALPIVSYKSHANGVLEYVDNDYRFTRIVIFPTIVVGKPAIESEVFTLLQEAHKHCLVANSIASIVEVNPTIMVQ